MSAAEGPTGGPVTEETAGAVPAQAMPAQAMPAQAMPARLGVRGQSNPPGHAEHDPDLSAGRWS